MKGAGGHEWGPTKGENWGMSQRRQAEIIGLFEICSDLIVLLISDDLGAKPPLGAHMAVCYRRLAERSRC